MIINNYGFGHKYINILDSIENSYMYDFCLVFIYKEYCYVQKQ